MPLRPFQRGQGRPPGSGRRKGSKNKHPKNVPGLLEALDRIATKDAGLVYGAMTRGLRAKPPHSAPYIRIVLERKLGPVPDRPVESHPPLVFMTVQQIGRYDPLAALEEPPSVVPEAIRIEATRALMAAQPAPPVAPPAPPPPPAAPPAEFDGMVSDPAADAPAPARRKNNRA